MLQSMRYKASWVIFIVVGIITFMIAITGLETLVPNLNKTNTVATVNGKNITNAQLNQSIEQQKRMLIQQMGEQFYLSLIDEKLLTESVLQLLINRTLLLQKAKKYGMAISKKELDTMIISMPELHQDGKFNQDQFIMMVQSLNISPMQFRNLLQDEMILQQIQSGITATEFVTLAEIKRLIALENQKRDIAWLTLDVGRVLNSIEPTEDQIKTYYTVNSDQYMTPEQVKINYIKMDMASFLSNIEVNEKNIKDEYQRRLQDLEENANTTDTQTVSTIFIQTSEKRSEEEANAIANEVEKKLHAGEDFATLAKEYSDDPVTSVNGGDIYEAAIALAPDQISAPIKTNFGFHIIKVTSREKEQILSFDALKNEILIDLKKEIAKTLFLDKTRQLEDISFEASDLNQPAEQLDLMIQSEGPFTRQGGTGISANPKVIAAAFSHDVLNLGANSELIELTPDSVLVLRVKKHFKSKLRPQNQVQASIVQSLKIEEARKLLQTRAKALLAALNDQQSLKIVFNAALSSFSSLSSLSWTENRNTTRRQQNLPPELVTASFKMPHPAENKSTFTQVELSNGNIAIVALKNVTAGTTTEVNAQRDRMTAMYIADGNGSNLFHEYLKSLQEAAKIKISQK